MLVNLKAEMARHKKTISDMAKFLGVSAVTYSLKLNGKREFTLDEISKIANLFGVSIEYLAAKQPLNPYPKGREWAQK